MGKAAVVRCKFCNWSRPLWWTSDENKRMSGWHALRRHVSNKHREEFDRIQELLDKEYGTEEEEEAASERDPFV